MCARGGWGRARAGTVWELKLGLLLTEATLIEEKEGGGGFERGEVFPSLLVR